MWAFPDHVDVYCFISYGCFFEFQYRINVAVVFICEVGPSRSSVGGLAARALPCSGGSGGPRPSWQGWGFPFHTRDLQGGSQRNGPSRSYILLSYRTRRILATSTTPGFRRRDNGRLPHLPTTLVYGEQRVGGAANLVRSLCHHRRQIVKRTNTICHLLMRIH
jgi:hypothetical protein